MLGANILSHSRTHATVALSSGEANFVMRLGLGPQTHFS